MDDQKALKQKPKIKDKWCAFYKNWWHDIEYCGDLDKVLHGLGNKKKLDKYLKNRPQERRRYLDKKLKGRWLLSYAP